MSRSRRLLLDVLTLLPMLAMLGSVAMRWNALPDAIPTHFNVQGDPDRYGSKGQLLFVAALGVLLPALLWFVERRPNLINVPGPRTERAVTTSIWMLRGLRPVTAGLFACVAWSMMEGTGLTAAFWVLLAATLGVVIVGLVRITLDAG